MLFLKKGRIYLLIYTNLLWAAINHPNQRPKSKIISNSPRMHYLKKVSALHKGERLIIHFKRDKTFKTNSQTWWILMPVLSHLCNKIKSGWEFNNKQKLLSQFTKIWASREKILIFKCLTFKPIEFKWTHQICCLRDIKFCNMINLKSIGLMRWAFKMHQKIKMNSSSVELLRHLKWKVNSTKSKIKAKIQV